VFPFLFVNLSAIPWDFDLVLIVLGVAVPWRGAVRVRRLLAQPALSAQRLSLYASTIAFQWFIVAVIYWRSAARHLSPADLGLVVSGVWRTLSVTFVFTALLCLNQWAGLRKIALVPADQRGFLFQFTQKIMPHTTPEAFAFIALALTAGLSEEFIYRGFVLAVFSGVFGSSLSGIFLSAVASSIWFAVAHLYQGRRGIATTFIVGMMFWAVRIWTGNLVPAVVAHVGVDMVAGLYGPRLLRTRTDLAGPGNNLDGAG
jgi:membrane protease YdiL (CAAX protease family)